MYLVKSFKRGRGDRYFVKDLKPCLTRPPPTVASGRPATLPVGPRSPCLLFFPGLTVSSQQTFPCPSFLNYPFVLGRPRRAAPTTTLTPRKCSCQGSKEAPGVLPRTSHSPSLRHYNDVLPSSHHRSALSQLPSTGVLTSSSPGRRVVSFGPQTTTLTPPSQISTSVDISLDLTRTSQSVGTRLPL